MQPFNTGHHDHQAGILEFLLYAGFWWSPAVWTYTHEVFCIGVVGTLCFTALPAWVAGPCSVSVSVSEVQWAADWRMWKDPSPIALHCSSSGKAELW